MSNQFWRILSIFLFFLLTPFAIGEESWTLNEIDNGSVGVRYPSPTTTDSTSSPFRMEFFTLSNAGEKSTFATIPFSIPPKFAQFEKGETEETIRLVFEDRSLQFRVDSRLDAPDSARPFIYVSETPLFLPEGPAEIADLTLPSIQISSDRFGETPLDSLRAFGTGGLKPIDGHQGSYAFLSIVDPATNRGVVTGWITCHAGSGILFSGKTGEEDRTGEITPRIDYGRLPLNPEVRKTPITPETLVVGWFDDVRSGLEDYACELAISNQVKMKPAPVGYCTWYSDQFGGCGDEVSTSEFAKVAQEKLVPYGLSYFQIDDKWQLGDSKNGPNKNFTDVRPEGSYRSGIRKTADLLNRSGLTCGLWFMPFSGNFDDPYFADKQDLFVRSGIDYPAPGEKNTRTYPSIDQKKGAPYETFWGGTALDMTNPKTRDYTSSIVRRIAHDWNCRFFKIDGMWVGGAIEQLYVNDEYKPDDIGKQIFHDPSLTNMEAFRLGMKTVREAAGEEVFILGCNLSQNMRTLLGSVGYVDGMRVGPDNGSDWNGICSGPWRGTNRYFLNGRVWWNDPDPVYVRDAIPLDHARVITSWAALTGQLYAFADWLPALSEERVNVLRRTMPNHQLTSVRPVDLFTSDLARVWTLNDPIADVKPEEGRFVVGIFNWNETETADFDLTPEQLGLPTIASDRTAITGYAVYHFWEERFGKGFGPEKGEKNLSISVPGGSCAILAIRPESSRPFLLSTSRNITQGIYEVVSERWDEENQTLTITVDPRKAALAEELPYQLRLVTPTGLKSPTIRVTDASGASLPAPDPTVDGDADQLSLTFPPFPQKSLPEKNGAVSFVFDYSGK